MRYAQIRELDISNGENIGVSLFVQGCHFHCHNCFNQETWDFNGGKEWNEYIETSFLKLIDRPYIKRISILGGEPLADENVKDVLSLIYKIRKNYPDKKIWIYSGYTLDDIICKAIKAKFIYKITKEKQKSQNMFREEIIRNIDILVDGRYIDAKRDLTLKFRGSTNQRVIDIQETLNKGDVILHCK